MSFESIQRRVTREQMRESSERLVNLHSDRGSLFKSVGQHVKKSDSKFQ